MKLQNKVALITGGTSGIGLETAKLFRAEGAKVIVTGTNPERLEAAGKELGDDALVLSVDLRKPAEIERAVEEVRAKFGQVDIVFANARCRHGGPVGSRHAGADRRAILAELQGPCSSPSRRRRRSSRGAAASS